MNETQPALVNFTVETFPNERDMEFHLAQASKRFEVFMPRFKEAGLKKITSTKIWNKEGKAMVGWVFEYENAEAYQACLVCFSVFILKHPPNHRLAFFVPDLGGSDLLQSCLFEPWHEDFKAFGGLSQVKLHITLVWEGFDREVDQCGLCLVHRLSSFSVLILEEFADLNQL